MYCPDTLKRINEEKVAEYRAGLRAEEAARLAGTDDPEEFTRCEFCDENPAMHVIPVYNPADKINGRGQEAYAVYHVCDDCMDKGEYLEENFYCDDCGELFIYNHSWEVLAVTTPDGIFCQSCAANQIEENGSMSAGELLEILENDDAQTCASLFQKLDTLPEKTCLVSVDFSEYSDFPGCTSFDDLAARIREAMAEQEISEDTLVWPLLTGNRQFNVTLAVYY